MRINSVRTNVNFGRNLTSNEVKEYSDVLKQGKQLVGQTGHSIFIMPSSCLPQTKEFNTGIGHLSSDISLDYLKYMKTYLGFNVVEDLPAGQIPPTHNYHCAYKGSALALGNQQINPELLIKEEFGKILTKEDIMEIAKSNAAFNKDTISNFQNVMNNDGMQNTILKKAYENFKKLPENSSLKSDFGKYIKENEFWLNFERSYEPDLEFFKFKQFLADTHLKYAKDRLNKEGLKLCGDCLINFSKDEVKAFPNAFIKDGYIGASDWRTAALDFNNILNPNSDAHKLLKTKVQLFAKRYDMIRFDAAWLYISPTIKTSGSETRVDLGSKLLDQIETWVKEVKGNDYDLKNLIYEFEAGAKDFKAFENNQLVEPIRNRMKVHSSQYMHSDGLDRWGTRDAFIAKGFTPDTLVLGATNHDSQPLKQVAKGIPNEVQKGIFINHKTGAIKALSEALNIPEISLENPVEFAKAKWADPMQARNMMMFYNDILGNEECFDLHWKKNTEAMSYRNYALKVPTDYATAYQKGIQSGFGFNPMDSLEKLFIKKGLDKSNPDLFAKIVKFKNILYDPKEIITSPPKNKGIALPIIFAGVGVLAIAAAYKFLKNKNHTEENLTQNTKEITNTTTTPEASIGKFYSMNDFLKK